MSCFDFKNGLSKECFEVVLQSMAEALFIVDTQGIIRFCNQSLETMTGKSVDSVLGKRCQDIMVCACGSMKDCSLLSSGTLSNIECQLLLADGSRLPVLKNGRVLLNEHGKMIGAVETLTDISALKKTQRKVAALEQQVSRDSGKFQALIGKSPAMEQVFDLIDLAALSNATVLITGDSGTGKELVARSIHERGPRSSGPLVKVNCSALPETLLESELFGHVKGAFTGAIKDKMGRFELADGGTLFLDEIGDVSPFIQVKLLRFLQEREFERVGESNTRKADVRIIAATNRDLRELIRAGAFREDLFYRLKVFPLNLPTLSQRKEDIGLLISYFVNKFNKETGKNIIGLNHEAAVTMMDYCWPGNIRELENAIEHAFVTCRETEIGIFDLPLEIRRVELRSVLCTPAKPYALIGERSDRGGTIVTKEKLADALAISGGNKGKTAKALGIDRTTLWRRMKQFEL